MGRMLVAAIDATDDLAVSALLDRADSPQLGQALSIKSPRVAIAADIDAALAASDVLIDFTRPEGTARHLESALAHGTRLVIGTTGFDATGRDAIERAATTIPIVFAPNMSVGVNVVFKLVADAARALADGYDVEIIEAHHRHKVDAPSGTAVRMAELVAAARGVSLADVASYGREGIVGPRPASTIGFSAIRGGDIVGDHTVLFAGTGERIEITHRSGSRDGYATGALAAARFVASRPAGLYDMQDVLGLR